MASVFITIVILLLWVLVLSILDDMIVRRRVDYYKQLVKRLQELKLKKLQGESSKAEDELITKIEAALKDLNI